VPHPTADEIKTRGSYASQYAIITGCNDVLSEHVTAPMNQAVSRGAVTSLQDLITRRSDLTEIRRGMADLRTELDKQLAAADAAHAALKQPADLKSVFDAAYGRDVTGPANAFQQVIPVAESALAAAVDVGDFIAQHGNAVSVQGAQV
jgi:hypothetical protein